MNATSRAGWGLLAVALASLTVEAQQPAARQGRSAVGIARVRSLYEMARFKGVHKEIGLTDFTKLDALKAELRKVVDDQRPASADREALKGLSGPERIAKLTELRSKSNAIAKKVYEEFDVKLRDALTPEQLARVKEIFIQFAGADALAHREVAKDLGLSEEQQQKIAGIQTEWDKANSEALLSGAVGDPGGTLLKMQEMHGKMLAKATEVLSPEQKKKLDELKGKPFDFSQLGSGR